MIEASTISVLDRRLLRPESLISKYWLVKLPALCSALFVAKGLSWIVCGVATF